MHKDLAIVILAAGASNRLGRCKQLEPLNGKSLLHHAIDVATEAEVGHVFTVIGANMDTIKSHIAKKNTTILENHHWALGMSTSIVFAIEYIESHHANIQKIIFMVCDQPYVSAALLQALINKNINTLMPIIASEYHDIKGTPALFDQSIFGLLKKLNGDVGAGKMIKQNIDIVASVPFDKGEIDIDKESDLALFE